MKKRLAVLFLLLVFLFPATTVGETVVSSFYPIWLFALNLTDGLEDVRVCNLAAPDTGCLHDYQLQTGDMKTLAAADVFLINGAGMESYLDNVFAAFPDLPVISASEGVPLLTSVDALEIGEDGAAEKDTDEVNAHIWLDVSNAIRMTENLAKGLSAYLPGDAGRIEANRDALILRLQALDETLKTGLADLPETGIVTFHEAFPYFAKAYGLRVLAVVNREPGETLSPAQLARLIVTVKDLGNPPLFVEPQYEDLSARTLAAETGAAVYTLDPVVTGPSENVPLDYYETVMLRNMEVLRQALANGH